MAKRIPATVREWMAALGRKGGASKSEAKRTASKRNIEKYRREASRAQKS